MWKWKFQNPCLYYEWNTFWPIKRGTAGTDEKSLGSEKLCWFSKFLMEFEFIPSPCLPVPKVFEVGASGEKWVDVTMGPPTCSGFKHDRPSMTLSLDLLYIFMHYHSQTIYIHICVQHNRFVKNNDEKTKRSWKMSQGYCTCTVSRWSSAWLDTKHNRIPLEKNHNEISDVHFKLSVRISLLQPFLSKAIHFLLLLKAQQVRQVELFI